MNERYESHENHPCLFEFEIRALANLAIAGGEIREANHRDIQAPDRPSPHFFNLKLGPQEIDSRWRLRPDEEAEVITGVSIEYNEPMFIPDDEIPMDPWVTVSVVEKIYEATIGDIIDREMRYRLSLIPGGVCEAIETRTDRNVRSDIEVDNPVDALLILAHEARPLNEDDLQFLRLLISRR